MQVIERFAYESARASCGHASAVVPAQERLTEGSKAVGFVSVARGRAMSGTSPKHREEGKQSPLQGEHAGQCHQHRPKPMWYWKHTVSHDGHIRRRGQSTTALPPFYSCRGAKSARNSDMLAHVEAIWPTCRRR